MKFALILVFVCFLLITYFEECGASVMKEDTAMAMGDTAMAVMEIEERSTMWDQINALARLPGDMVRRDYIAALMDGIIVVEFLPIPSFIIYILGVCYSALKFIQPAYWWLFPSTKPPNIKGRGFQKLF